MSLGVAGLYHYLPQAQNDMSAYQFVSLMGTGNIYFGRVDSNKKEVEKLKSEQQAAAAEAEAQRQQALAAQQAAAQAEAARLEAEKQAQANAQAAQAAQASAVAASSEAAVQVQQAQAEVEAIKGQMARKEITPILFKSGGAQLQESSYPTLDKVVDVEKKYPSLNLRIEGHTDNTGSEAANQTLSEHRAESVRTYLISKGVPADRVKAVGYGESKPTADNSTAEGRAKNRRVEFIFETQQGQ